MPRLRHPTPAAKAAATPAPAAKAPILKPSLIHRLMHPLESNKTTAGERAGPPAFTRDWNWAWRSHPSPGQSLRK